MPAWGRVGGYRGVGRQKAGGCLDRMSKTAWLTESLISSLTVRFGRHEIST